MKRMIWVSLIAFGIHCTVVQCQSSQRGTNSRSQAELAAILNKAGKFPVEYNAALTFSALDNAPTLLTRTQQIHKLSNLLQNAPSAHYPSSLFYGGRNSSAGVALASEEGLYLHLLRADQLDIEMEAVERLSKLDPKQAVEAFQEIRLPNAPTPCEVSGVPNYEAYYIELVKLSALPPEVLHTTRQAFFTEAADRLDSASALAGYLRTVPSVHLDSLTWASVGAKVSRSLDGLHPTDRELAALDRDGELHDSVAALLSRLHENGIDTTELLQAYRRFLVKGLGGESCTDFSLDRSLVRQGFERLRTTGQARQNVRPLEETEISGTPDRGAKENMIQFDDKLRPPMQKLMALSDANRVKRYKDHDSTEIQPEDQDVEEIVRLSRSDYDNGKDCEVCRFINRQETLSTLLDLLPGGSASRSVIKEEIRSLEFSPLEDDNPPAWLFIFQQTLSIARAPDEASRKALERTVSKGDNLVLPPSGDAESIRSGFANSSDPLIHLFGRAEILLKPPYKPFGPPESAP